MSLFICAKCGCVENTATSEYWSIVSKSFHIDWADSLKEFEDKPICSECGLLAFDETGNNSQMVPDKWHNRFEKKLATEEQKQKAGRNGIIPAY